MRLGGGRGVLSPFGLLKEVSFRWFVGCVCVLCRFGNNNDDDGNEAVEEGIFEEGKKEEGFMFFVFFVF